MKILFIYASPRPSGVISGMLDAVRQEAVERGHEVVEVRVASLQVRPCTGCMKCRTALECCLPPDDAQRVLALVCEADALVVGAPCYWGNMPGALKVLFDRMVYGMMGENSLGVPRPLHRGKRAVIVSSCTTIYPFNIWFRQSRGVVNALKEILKWSGFRITRTIEKGDTKRHPLLTERDLRKCRKALRSLER